MLNFVATGTGHRAMALLHGWCCDRQAMAPVADGFPDFRCVSIDLLGHGASPKADDLSIEAQAQAVLAVMPDQAILIGHSMGAQVAVEAARQAPDRVRAIVLLDPAQILPAPAALPFREAMRRLLAGPDLAVVLRGFATSGVRRATDPAMVAELADKMGSANPETARAGWEAIWNWDGAAALKGVSCPALVIVAEKTTNMLREMAKLNDNVMTAQVAGAGHMIQFEVMPQIEAMIRRFLALNGLDSEAASR